MEEIRKMTSRVILDQKARQKLYEALIDSDLLPLCQSKDSAKITEYITRLFESYKIPGLAPKIETIIKSIFKT
jgi:hypothetical protein